MGAEALDGEPSGLDEHAARTARGVEDEAENRRGVFLEFDAGVGAELVASVPEALFRCAGAGLFFGWDDPLHEAGRESISNGFDGKGKEGENRGAHHAYLLNHPPTVLNRGLGDHRERLLLPNATVWSP